MGLRDDELGGTLCGNNSELLLQHMKIAYLVSGSNSALLDSAF